MSHSAGSELNRNLFIEQAEYLEPERFREWSTEHPDEEAILRKLTQSGAKLLTGPRGCGKTTLLLKAYKRMLRTGHSALPVYVNFKASLKLEPLYRNNANAVYWFNQWLLLKVYEGLHVALGDAGVSGDSVLSRSLASVKAVTGQLELGHTQLTQVDADALSIPMLEDEISRAIQSTDRVRCVLLLDDAAHAFSSEQQRDFFDFFRQIKSRYISPKAAIYPGVTIYSPTFHIGHDAEA